MSEAEHIKVGKAVEVEKRGQFIGHKDPVFVLEPYNEHQFFTSGGDGIVARWDLDKPDEGEMISKLDSSVYALHYESEEERLIVAQNYFGLRILDLKTCKEVRAIQLTQDALFDLLVIEDYLMVMTSSGKLMILDKQSFELLKVYHPCEESGRCLALQPGGKQFAAGFSDNKLRMYQSSPPFEVLFNQSTHENSVFCLAFDQSGDYLISGGRDAHLRIWDTKTMQEVADIPAHLFTINHIAFRPDYKYFATGSMDKTIKIWHTESNRLVKVIDKARHDGHTSSINKLLWLEERDLLVSVSDDRQVAVWKIHLD